MLNVVVTGSASGLGNSIYKHLYNYRDRDCQIFNPIGIDKDACNIYTDFCTNIASQSNCIQVASEINKKYGQIQILINCAGINHLSKIEDLKENDLNKVMQCNLHSILFMTQAFLSDLKKNKGTIINIVSNASHMPMTHSFAYNASKGAAAIATKQMARELTKEYGITVFGISPNKLAGTQMSEYIDSTFPPMRGLTFDQGRQYQLNGLITGKETEPAQVATLLPQLLKDKYSHEFLSGCILPLGL